MSMKIKIIGIDPGASGAIALLDPETGALIVEDMPTVSMRVSGKNRNRVSEPMLADIIRGWHLTSDLFALVEEVNAMPKQGVSSTFTFGRAFGVVTGVLSGVGVPFETIRPQQWKSELKLTKGKDAARAYAARLFPNDAGLFRRKMDDGRAEAALIALVAKQKIQHPTKTC